MEDKDQIRKSISHDLDAALAKYAAVEPRSGLEERILAGLRAEPAKIPSRALWQWGTAVAVVALLAVAAVLVGKSREAQHEMVQHRPATPERALPSSAQVVSSRQDDAHLARPLPARTKAGNPPRRAIETAALPMLDQFPSPQPLSEQEKILANYVAANHQQAVLLARVRMAELKQDLAEEAGTATASSDGTLSEPPANQQTDR